MQRACDYYDDMESIRSLSLVLNEIKASVNTGEVTFGDFLSYFAERGFGFFLFLFALPAALPVPAIGINAIIALPLILLTAQQALGRSSVWLPQRIHNKTISADTLHGFIDAAVPWVKRLEFFVRPRLSFLTSAQMERVIGVAGFIMALSVTIPLPLTNTVPSFGIALMAIGVLMRDGLAVLLGALIGILWVSMLIFVTVKFGPEGAEVVKEFIKSWI